MNSLRTLGAVAALLLLTVLGSLLASVEIDSSSNFNTDFEADEGYAPGYLVSDPIWNIDGSSPPEIGNFAYSGLLGLNLDDDGAISLDISSLETPSVGWVDLYLKPSFAATGDLVTSFPLGQAALTGFAKIGVDGGVYALHGEGQGNGTWMPTGYTVALDGNTATNWLRLTYRLDYGTQHWDLYLESTLQMIDLGFVDASAPPLSRFSLEGSSEGATHFDQFTAGFINPLFTDADNDGIDDAYEAAQGLSTTINDRDGDLDFDGVLNIFEYMNGLQAGNPDSDGDGVNDGAELAAGANPAVADTYSLQNVPYTEGFESYTIGDLSAQSLWQTEDGSASVQSSQVFAGAQALEFQAGQGVLELDNDFDGSDLGPIWLEFYLQPVRYNSPVHEAVENSLEADVTAAFYFLEGDQLAILDGDGQGAGTWSVVDHPSSATGWTRVIVRNDYAAQKFHIWINGTLIEGNFGFANRHPYFSRMLLKQNAAASAYLDDIHIAAEEPAGLDDDGDGMSDGWELAYGLDPLDPSDASANPDGDLLTNLEEFTFGTDPHHTDSDGDGLDDGYGMLGFVRREIWRNVHSNNLSELINRSAFPDNPDEFQWMDMLMTETGYRDTENYADRVRGFIIPDVSAEYVFHVMGDENTEFWMSSDHHGFNKERVALVPKSTNRNEWTKYPEQTSQPCSLVAGQRYYFEALHAEGRNLDFHRIGWSRPDLGGAPEIITGEFLQSWQPDPLDLDDDGLEDAWESQNGLDPTVAKAPLEGAYGDFDSDGLTNLAEKHLGTDPTLADSDGDGVSDGIEHLEGTSPLDPADLPVQLLPATETPALIGQTNYAELYTLSDSREVLFSKGEGNLGPYGVHGGLREIDVTAIFDVVVRVDSFQSQYSESSGEFGLILRSSTQALEGSISIYRNHQTFYAMRTLDGVPDYQDGAAAHVPVESGPVWLRMTKTTDSMVTVFYSLDGSTWTQLASHLWLPQETPLVGLFAASGHAVDLSKTVFEVEMLDVDSDGDGLLDSEEIALGTDPLSADTDGDGVSDYDALHIYLSDPNVNDIGASQTVHVFDFAAGVAATGSWNTDANGAYSTDAGGIYSQSFTLTEAGIYELDLIATPHAYDGDLSEYKIDVSIDGQFVQRVNFSMLPGESDSIKLVLPWLQAGTHQVDLKFINFKQDRNIRYTSMQLSRHLGPDADGNGKADWIDHRLNTLNGFEELSFTSATSPFCLIGRSKHLDFTESADVAQQLFPLPDAKFYTDVPLDPAVATSVSVEFENGALIETVQIEWLPTNIADTEAISIRKGDALLLTAFEETSLDTDQVVIDLGDGSAPVTTTVDTPLEAIFESAGEFIVTATVNGIAHQITVTVMEADLGETLSLAWGKTYSYQPPILPQNAVIEIDDNVELAEVTQNGQPREFEFTPGNLESGVWAAVTPTGAILDHATLEPFILASSLDTRVEVTDYYDDGAALVEIDFVISNPPADLRAVVRIFVGGITFDDGSIEKILTSEDFDELGRTTLKFIMPFEAITSVCHRIYVYSGDEFLGQQ